MRGRFVAIALALVSTNLAGCLTELLDEGSDEKVQIAKKVVVTLTEDTFEGDDPRIEDVLKTRFEYTHRGAAAAPSEISAEYLTEAGTSRTSPLSSFTSASVLNAGDVVTIPNVNFTSGLIVKKGADLLASRGGIRADWLRAEGVPIPIATSRDGVVRYAMTSRSGFDAEVAGVVADDVQIESAIAEASAVVDGTLEIKTIPNAQGTRLEALAHLVPTLDVFASAKINEGGSRYEVGIETQDMRGTFDAMGMLQFDQSRNLRKTGGSGKAFFDGNVYVWDKEHSRDSHYTPEDIEHPMLKEEEAYSESDVESGDEPEAWIRAFLERLWSMEIGVGDDYRLHASFDAPGGGFEFDIIIQIAGTEVRAVGPTLHPSYRVTELANLVVRLPGGAESSFDLIHGTFWLSKESYLPVYAQVSQTRSFDRADVERLLRTFGSDAPFEVPESVSLAVRGEQTLSMTSYSGNFRTSPIMGVLLSNPASMAPMIGAATVFRLVADIGADSKAVPLAPAIAFSTDETADRIRVSSASSEADWSRLGVKLGSSPTATIRMGGAEPYQNDAASASGEILSSYGPTNVAYNAAPVRAGDFLSFCASGPATNVRFVLIDLPSNAVVADMVLSTVRLCT